MTITSPDTPILFIDDSPEDFQAVRRCFTKLGFRNPLVYCSGGEEALNLLDPTSAPTTPVGMSLKPGCILLDLNMPGMAGREILRTIKIHPRLKQFPVVMFSTSDDQEDINTCYREGANSYMVKPPDFDGLVKPCRYLRVSGWKRSNTQPNQDQQNIL